MENSKWEVHSQFVIVNAATAPTTDAATVTVAAAAAAFAAAASVATAFVAAVAVLGRCRVDAGPMRVRALSPSALHQFFNCRLQFLPDCTHPLNTGPNRCTVELKDILFLGFFVFSERILFKRRILHYVLSLRIMRNDHNLFFRGVGLIDSTIFKS